MTTESQESRTPILGRLDYVAAQYVPHSPLARDAAEEIRRLEASLTAANDRVRELEEEVQSSHLANDALQATAEKGRKDIQTLGVENTRLKQEATTEALRADLMDAENTKLKRELEEARDAMAHHDVVDGASFRKLSDSNIALRLKLDRYEKAVDEIVTYCHLILAHVSLNDRLLQIAAIARAAKEKP